MEATISVVCYKSKKLSNGEFPLMIRIAKDGKRTMKSLGVSINPVHWDFKKNCPKKNCPNRADLTKLISQTLSKYQGRAIEAKSKGEDVSVFSLIEEKNQFVCRIYVDDFLTSHIQMLRDSGKVGNSYAYLNLRATLRKFYGKKLNITFNEIDIAFCNKFEVWMRKNNYEDTTMSFYFRTL